MYVAFSFFFTVENVRGCTLFLMMYFQVPGNIVVFKYLCEVNEVTEHRQTYTEI